MQRRTVIGTLLAMLALGMAGCGGSDGPSSTAGFTKAGNAVCTKAMKQFKAGLSNGNVEHQFVALQHAKISGLGGLEPPDGLDRVYAQYEKVLASRLDVVQRYLAAARANANLHALRGAVLQARVEEAALAKALGFTACDENSI